MKMLCITGVSKPDLIQIKERFCQAGMAEPLSIERNGKQLNMRQWHDRFCDKALMAEEISSICKFGEQLASEIFFSNMDSFWGWADNRSVHLLDFWAEFDPNLVFLLTVCPLDYHLARLMETEDAASLNLEGLISSWHYTHEHLLRFYHKHQERCLLVDVHDCITQFNALSKVCQDKWNLPLESPSETQLKKYPFPAPLARHIAVNFLDTAPEVTSLWNELEATASKFASDTNRPNDISFNEIAQSYQTLKDRSYENQQLSDLKEKLNGKENQLRTFEKEQREKQEQLQAKLNNLEQHLNALQQQHKETEEENDLVLKQLHQVQEELESMFLQKQDAEQQWAEQQKKLQNDFKEKDQQLQSLRNEKESQLRTLEKEQREKQGQLQAKLNNQEQQLKALQQQHKETEEENDLILSQLHQVQEELESMFLQKQDAEHQWTEQQKKLQKDVQEKELQLQSLREEHKKIRHENEQRLYQLHEVQEELGRYLIEDQEQSKALEKANARWERLLKRIPDYCDYGRIRVMGDDASHLTWEIQDLEIGSQTYPELEFQTFLLGGIAGFRFKKPEQMSQGDLIPVAQTSEDAKKQVKIFKNLTTNEWFLLQPLAHFLKTYLRTEKLDDEKLTGSPIQETIRGLDRLEEILSRFPEALRFDQISIDENTLSEDCEQLEFRLENLSYGGLICPQFLFRLACAGLKSSDFGSNPRLEFMEETTAMLNSWFDCSSNPNEPRLELRFALPEAMDLDVWNKLSNDDARFIHELTAHLPILIENNVLQSGDADSKWLIVAKEVEKILKRRTTAQKENAA